MNYLVFDAEIKRAIPQKGEFPKPQYQYCEGWKDYRGMGISVLVAYSSWDDRVHIIKDDNSDRFRELVNQTDVVSGFNIVSFDNPLVAECWGIEVPQQKIYDIRLELIAARQGATTFTKGYNLNKVAEVNGLQQKSEAGGDAPFFYQDRKFGRLDSYCVDDVWLETRAFRMCKDGTILDPITGELAMPRNPALLIPAQPLG